MEIDTFSLRTGREKVPLVVSWTTGEYAVSHGNFRGWEDITIETEWLHQSISRTQAKEKPPQKEYS